jgi:hypothetical protein
MNPSCVVTTLLPLSLKNHDLLIAMR